MKEDELDTSKEVGHDSRSRIRTRGTNDEKVWTDSHARGSGIVCCPSNYGA